MATLGYWDIRGIASPIRNLLAYLGIEYTNKTYTGAGDEWHKQDKLTLATKFPNIPYYVEEDGSVLTESAAISLYIIKKNKRLDLLA